MVYLGGTYLSVVWMTCRYWAYGQDPFISTWAWVKPCTRSIRLGRLRMSVLLPGRYFCQAQHMAFFWHSSKDRCPDSSLQRC